MEAKTATPGPRFIEPALNDIERIAERLRVDGRTMDGITKECAAGAIDKIVRIVRNCGVVRACNAYPDLMTTIEDFILDHDNGLGPSVDRLRAALAAAEQA